MNIEGKIHRIFDTQNVTASFRKQDFVVEYIDNPMYPQYISFQCTQDKTALLDSLRIGDKVDVTFNLRGREWTSPDGEIKYFNTLEAWRISKVEASDAQPPGGGYDDDPWMPTDPDGSDLPF